MGSCLLKFEINTYLFLMSSLTFLNLSRTRSGIAPPLSTRATRAAWALNGVSNEGTPPNDANDVPGNTANSMLRAATQFRENSLGELYFLY